MPLAMIPPVSTDVETNFLFDSIVELLQGNYSRNEAEALAREYYRLFRDPEYCKSINIPAQDHEFFHHYGAAEMARRIHYYLGIKGDPDPHRYLDWRQKFQRETEHRRREMKGLPRSLLWP
jgi:hypothetical protein